MFPCTGVQHDRPEPVQVCVPPPFLHWPQRKAWQHGVRSSQLLYRIQLDLVDYATCHTSSKRYLDDAW
jgi:hypothetical protein